MMVTSPLFSGAAEPDGSVRSWVGSNTNEVTKMAFSQCQKVTKMSHPDMLVILVSLMSKRYVYEFSIKILRNQAV